MPPARSPLSLHDALPIWNGRVAVDQLGEHAAQRLDAERQRGHVEEQHVLDVAAQHAALDRGADRHDLVGVDALVGLLAEEVLRSEEHTSELQSRFDLVCRLRAPLFPYTTLFRSGMVVLRSISLVNTPPSVSMPSDSGVTSRSSMSLTSPRSTPPWIAAPTATTSSGLTPLLGSLPKKSLDRKSTRLNSSHVSISYAACALPSFPTRRSSDLEWSCCGRSAW